MSDEMRKIVTAILAAGFEVRQERTVCSDAFRVCDIVTGEPLANLYDSAGNGIAGSRLWRHVPQEARRSNP